MDTELSFAERGTFGGNTSCVEIETGIVERREPECHGTPQIIEGNAAVLDKSASRRKNQFNKNGKPCRGES